MNRQRTRLLAAVMTSLSALTGAAGCEEDTLEELAICGEGLAGTASPTQVAALVPADRTGPVLRLPIIDIGLGYELDCDSASLERITVTGPSGEAIPVGRFGCTGNPTTLSVRPTRPLANATEYTVVVDGLKNTRGEAITACRSRFTVKTRTTAIGCGGASQLALDEDGTLWSWGDSLSEPQSGHGDRSAIPRRVDLGGKVVALAAGDGYQLAARADGTVWAWGVNYWGQLGDGTTDSSGSTPVQVKLSLPQGVTVTALAARFRHALALGSDGRVRAWGANNSYALGVSDTSDHSTPVEVPGLSEVMAIAAGEGSNGGAWSLALKSDGTVWGWGGDGDGQLGLPVPDPKPYFTTPTQISGLSDVKAIAAGSREGFALTTGGTVYGWGDTIYGAVGDGQCMEGLRIPPVALPVSGAASVAGANHAGMVVKSDGTVWGWGWNSDALLGDGTRGAPLTHCNEQFPEVENVQRTPTQARGIAGAVAISAYEHEALILESDGSVWGAGYNTNDKLGIDENATFLEGTAFVAEYAQVPGL